MRDGAIVSREKSYSRVSEAQVRVQNLLFDQRLPVRNVDGSIVVGKRSGRDKTTLQHTNTKLGHTRAQTSLRSGEALHSLSAKYGHQQAPWPRHDVRGQSKEQDGTATAWRTAQYTLLFVHSATVPPHGAQLHCAQHLARFPELVLLSLVRILAGRLYREHALQAFETRAVFCETVEVDPSADETMEFDPESRGKQPSGSPRAGDLSTT